MHKNTNRSRDMAILDKKLFSKLYIYVLDKHNYALYNVPVFRTAKEQEGNVS